MARGTGYLLRQGFLPMGEVFSSQITHHIYLTQGDLSSMLRDDPEDIHTYFTTLVDKMILYIQQTQSREANLQNLYGYTYSKPFSTIGEYDISRVSIFQTLILQMRDVLSLPLYHTGLLPPSKASTATKWLMKNSLATQKLLASFDEQNLKIVELNYHLIIQILERYKSDNAFLIQIKHRIGQTK